MKYRFLILFIFFFLLLFIPYSAKADVICCECTPPQYSIDGNPKLQRVCVNRQDKPCDVVCPSGQVGPSPYPYAEICDANNCPLTNGSYYGCCVWTTQDNNIICNTVDNASFRIYDCLYALNSTIVSREHIDNIYSCAQEPRCTSDYVVPTSSNIEETKPFEFVPQVTIPGSIDVGGKTFTVNQGQGITVDGSLLSKYIAILFNWLIGAIGVVTVAYLAFGGLQWLGAAGNASGINKAKETIRDALIGMLLVAGSYTMLYVINPNLVFFRNLRVTPVESSPLSEGGDVAGSGEIPQCDSKNLRGQAAASEIIHYGLTFQNKVTYHLGGKDPTVACSSDSDIVTYRPCEKYNWPGFAHPDKGDSCLDCSGFVSWLYNCSTGVYPPSFTKSLASWSGTDFIKKAENLGDLLPGDFFGYAATGNKNNGHVMIVYSRDTNQPNQKMHVHGSCEINQAMSVDSIDWNKINNQCKTQSCFGFHIVRETDFNESCVALNSVTPCGLRKANQGKKCTYNSIVNGIGQLSGGCKEVGL